MKKLLWFCGTVGIIAALAQTLLLFTFRPAPPPLPAGTGAFSSYPLNTPQTVSFAPLDGKVGRQRDDQLRDWLLLSVLADANLAPAELNAITFDMPPVRNELLKPLGNFEYGATRSRLLARGQIVALVPTTQTGVERRDSLGTIVDQHRKNSGELPREVLVFEYALDADGQVGTVTRRPAVPAADLFRSESGYHTAIIANPADLERFLATVDDVTTAQLVGGKLQLGGRKLASYSYRGIGIEEIAALWQSEDGLLTNAAQREVGGSGFSLDWRYDYKAIQAAFTAIEPLLRTVAAKRPLTLAAFQKAIAAIAQNNARLGASLEDVQSSLNDYALTEQFFAQALGGTLTEDDVAQAWDAVDRYYPPLLASLANDADAKRILEQLAAGDAQTIDIFKKGQATFENDLRKQFDIKVSLTRPEIQGVGAALAKKDIRALNELVKKMDNSSGGARWYLSRLLSQARNTHTHQFARYDGNLAGTEVGMLLFYTDLLAKMWSFDYRGSAPNVAIPGFQARPDMSIPVLHKEAMERLNSSRLWFEPRPAGYQVVAGALPSLLFERNATHIVSLSSDPTRRQDDANGALSAAGGDAEEAANPESAAFIGWWDSHFEEIARYEPEYERLNQLMKWSMIISWLNADTKGGTLAFLKGVDVRHDRWFPDWAAANRQLRFQDWRYVPFHPRNYKGEEHETLDLLQSAGYESYGAEHYLQGGVSLGSRRTIAQASHLAEDVSPLLRRSYLQYGADNLGPQALRSADNVTFNLADAADDAAHLVATIDKGTPLRDLTGDAIAAPFERTVTMAGNRLRLSTRLGNTPIGELNVVGDRNGFVVGWFGRDLDAGQALARNMAWSTEPELTLLADPGVQSVVRFGDDGGYLVKLKGSDGWMKAVPDLHPGEQIADGFQARVGTPHASDPTYNLAWLDNNGFADTFAPGSHLVYQIDEAAGTTPLGTISARGPPPAALPLDLTQHGATVHAHFDPTTGKLYLDLGNETSGAVASSLRTYDMAALSRQAVAGKPLRYTLADDLGAESKLADDFAGGPSATAKRISDDPAGFAERLGKSLVTELNAADGLLARGDDLGALRTLQGLERIHGPLPDIRLRQGLAEIGMNRMSSAASLTHDVERVALSEPSRFFNEINRRLEVAGLSTYQRASYHRLAAFADWRNHLLKQGLSPDRLSLAYVDDQIELRAVVDELPGGSPWKAADDLSEATVYVQDSPGLNNLDWYSSPESAIQQIISGQLGEVVRLPGGEIANFKPTVIYVGTQKETAFRVESSFVRPSTQFVGSYQPYVPEECPPDQAPCPEQSPTYVVIAQP